ncbi:MAG: hypothetical protein DRO12_01055 [Thermoprotei archaeon]|nr:MAG: hypothetical protein DRO12_01055 [Thermoprotei archaeon]
MRRMKKVYILWFRPRRRLIPTMMGVFSSLEKALEKVAKLPDGAHMFLYVMEYEVDSSSSLGTLVWNGLSEEDRKKLVKMKEKKRP